MSDSLVPTHNSLPPSSLHQFLPPSALEHVTLYASSTLPAGVFSQIFDLVKENMMEMYKRSSMGWSARKKREEMGHPAMRYLVLMDKKRGDEGEGEAGEGREEGKGGEDDWEDEDGEGEKVKGFASFMVTEEEGVEVIYCYELQLSPDSQRKGYGEELMKQLEGFGKNVGLRKAMLTVFTENTGAIRFYRRIGYEVDEISPGPRRLRSGEVREPTYYIFSKQI
ncbi:acyl-CoA N-acyltransferase [Trichophaea hybrida]|nr:acyl-CoA N-acyltransferase [Trichophaea hybrida]